MVKTIKVIHLAPGESVLITAAPGPTPPCQAAASCPYAAANKNSPVILMQNSHRKRSSLFSALRDGGLPMYIITISNTDHHPLEVEVSVDVYKVYEDSRRQEERQRYERRKHIDGRSFDNCLLFELATEPLEQTYERIERLREIQAVLQDIPPQQRERFILHFAYGYSYSEIAKMQG